MSRNSLFERWSLFPDRRFDLDFPLVYWFAGLWFYLKGFLYICFLYMIGSDPGPYEPAVMFETFYFTIMVIPALVLGYGFWNEKAWAPTPGLIYLFIDTPVILFRVLRLAEAGFLDSGLTQVFELGGFFLNLFALIWLFIFRSAKQLSKSSSRK
ncbi:MAG: hypothetical protein AB7V04_07770 [Desulfomonilaceae bacterium]